MPDITLINADPNAPEAQTCLRAYYDLLLEKFSTLTPAMLPLPLPDADSYRAPKGAFLLAMQGATPLGCASLRPIDLHTAEVKRLWVAPAARGMGIARRLMTALETRAIEIGYTTLKLDSNTNLPQAIALYRSMGWTDTAAYTQPPADIWLEKPL